MIAQLLEQNGEAERPSWWKWAIALTASLAAVLEIIDTSIVNVALTHMQASLGATLSEIGWVVTGYAIANVIIIPLSAWLGDYFGKKNYFVFSLIGFVVASVLCGMAPNLPFLIISRILQGLTGGGLLAKAQSIMLDTFPPEEQGMAQAVFGLGVIVGPVLGPTMGGFITDMIGWRWIFYINIPIGIIAILAAMVFLPSDKPSPNLNKKVDWLGICFLVVGLGALQTMLEEGHQDDWFASPFILAMAIISVVALVLFIWQELTIDNPAVDLRVLRYRSLVGGSIFSMVLGMGLYGALFAIPIFAQSILNYTATNTGLLLLPGALASGVAMVFVGKLSTKVDPRWMVALGAIVMAWNMFELSHINPMTNESSLFWTLIFRGLGMILMFLPLSIATFSSIPQKDIAAASGFYNLTRQIGGSIGIAYLTTFLAQRENLHRSVLVENINAFNPVFQQRLDMMTAFFVKQGASLQTAQQQAYAAINNILELQSSVISFGDIFFIVGVAFVLSLPLLLLFDKVSPSRQMPSDVH